MKNSEKQNLPENKKRFSGRRKIITAATLAVGLTACDPVPNDKIILNQDDKSVAVSYKYNFGWAESWTNVDYNIFVYKRWDKYEWTIEKRTDWLFSEKIQIESNDVDWVFESISDKTESEYITDKTRSNREDKLNFAKQAFKDSVLYNKNPSKWTIIMKYKAKK